jgi:hypothetical protein
LERSNRVFRDEECRMDYDKTEIATTYDKARALAPETARL